MKRVEIDSERLVAHDGWRCGPEANVRDREFVTFLRAQRAAVYNVICEICGNDVAWDVTQDVFLRLWRDTSFDPAGEAAAADAITVARSVARRSER